MTTAYVIDRAISALAAEHNGLVPTRLLHEAGVSKRSIGTRRASGLLVPVQRGVHAIANTELTPARLALGALLSVPEPIRWISHTTSLRIHGATLRDNVDSAHVSSTEAVRIAGVTAHRSLQMPHRSDLHDWFGALVARPWLAIVESASLLAEDELAVALDSLIQSGKTSLARVKRCSDQRRSENFYPGVRVLERLLDDRQNGAGLVRSFLEQDMSRLLRKAGLPPPVRNHRVVLSNGQIRTIDTAWPAIRLGLEAESWKHHSNKTDWGRSRIRDRELTALGWTMFAVVAEDVRKPATLLAQLAQTIAQFGREFGA